MVEGRKVAEVFPESVKKLWNEWELRVMVLLSLGMQVALVLMGSRRKRVASRRLMILTWCAYLMADWVAIVALGVLSSSQGGDELMAFWAPFLLLHLGGPDTITAFSFADNELWIRHLLGVAVQTFVTLYILIKSWRTTWLSFLTIPMLLPGTIKYGERSWVLRSANRDQFRESGVLRQRQIDKDIRVIFLGYRAAFRFMDIASETKPRASETEPMPEGPEPNILVKAHYFFENFKVLFVDLILGLRHRDDSQRYFFTHDSKTAFQVVEIELGFAYDTFYTKAPLNYTPWGFFSRFLTLSSTVVVLVMFSFVTASHNYRIVDVVITFILFGGAIILEIYAFILTLSSDWTNLWLTSPARSETLVKIISCLQFHQKHESRWSKSMSQYNLLSFSLNQMRKPTGVLRLVPRQNKKWVMEKMENAHQLKIRTQVSDELEALIFDHFREKSSTSIRDIASMCTYRGGGVLVKYEFFEELRWTTDVEFDHSILIWHVATDICYSTSDDADKKNDSIYKEISKQLADYMLYLLVMCPFMLPIGMGMLRFQDSCAEAVKLFKEEEMLTLESEDDKEACMKNSSKESSFRTKLLSMNHSTWDQTNKSVIREASKLAKYLEEEVRISDKKWEMVSNVWVEMLGYAANQCRGFYHAEQLAKGGELLTHVWFLMAHLGITQRYQE